MKFLPITPWTFVASLAFGILAAFYAKRAGKNPYLWFLLGMLLGVIGVFFLFFMPQRKKPIKLAPNVDRLFWYYLDEENKQRGPFKFSVLRQAWQKGTLSPNTYVWNETLDKWEPFERFTQS